MRKQLLIFCILFIGARVNAQFTLTLQVPPSGVLLKPQLWNAVITSSYPEDRQIFLGLTLSDAVTGEPILTASTVQFGMETGGLQVNESNLSPISYEYLSARVVDRGPDGYLPAGSFTACYTIFEIQENSGTPSVEECIPVTIEPVSPPVLNTPSNTESLQTHYPQFTWIPPTPTEIFSDLNYDFILVEEQQGQSAADAIQQNLPVYSSNQNDFYLNYPLPASALDTGKTYAWKVIAKNSSSFVAESEVWEFSIKDPSFTNAQILSPYTKLKLTVDESISISVKNLQVYYDNDAGDSSAAYNIYDIDPGSQNTGGLQLINSGAVNLNPGINLINLGANEMANLQDGKEYMFQLSNSRNEMWNMKFIYYNNK